MLFPLVPSAIPVTRSLAFLAKSVPAQSFSNFLRARSKVPNLLFHRLSHVFRSGPPIGRGGIVLNQVAYTERYVRPADTRKQRDARNIADNVRKKKSIISSLLRNMGATFAPAPDVSSPPRGRR